MGEQYAVTLPQLAELMGRSLRAARWLRDRWRRAGWVESRVVLAGRPSFVWLTVAGIRAVGLSYPRWSPSPGMLRHIEAVTAVRLMVAADAAVRWVGERDIDVAGDEHLPDALAVTDDGREVAVEVELTRKSRARTREIACELVARYAAVVYFAAPQSRPLLAEVAAEVGQRRIEVRDLPATATWGIGR